MIPLVLNISRANPLFLINSNPHNLYVRTPVTEFYGMDNTQSFMATFHQTLSKGTLLMNNTLLSSLKDQINRENNQKNLSCTLNKLGAVAEPGFG